MPALKIQDILSFSSEDPVHPTTNILSLNSTKTWRCKNPGEKYAYLILQLEKASLITGIDVGNDLSAFIEIFVGRTGNNDKFEVLLAMSSLMTPMESRNSSTCNRVRMFTTEHFVSEIRIQKWDKIKIVCTQPFNSHVTYGLAFITIQGSNEPKASKFVEVNTMIKNSDHNIGRFRFREESPEDITLNIGSLFARRKELHGLKPAAAIREASNITNHKLSKQIVSSPNTSKMEPNHVNSKGINGTEITKLNRNRDELIYNSEDTQSNKKFEKLIKKDKDDREFQKCKQNENTGYTSKRIKMDKTITIMNINKGYEKNNSNSSFESVSNTEPKNVYRKGNSRIEKNKTIIKNNKRADQINLNSSSNTLSSIHKNNIEGKRNSYNETFNIKKTSDLDITSKQKHIQKKVCHKSFNNLFNNVIFVLSGFQNPLRANLRKMALEMGASYQSDWNTRCTHLICAFSNTPKYQQVLGKGKIVKRTWIEDCHTQRKYIPWRRYSLVPSDASKDESEDEILDFSHLPSGSNSDHNKNVPSVSSDSEEEIQRIKKQIADKNNVQDETQDPFEMSTEIEEDTQHPILNFFGGKSFYLDDSVGAVAAITLRRYIIMRGGTICETLTSDIDYNITQTSNNSLEVSNVQPEWVYECNDMEMLLPISQYSL